MKQDQVAPDGIQAPTDSPFKQVSAKAAALIASTALAVSSCAQTTTTTKEHSAPEITLTDSFDAYKLKVAKMTEAELRAESDALAKVIQPMMDAGATDDELLPYLTRHDIVGKRLDPIIEASIKNSDKAIKELNYAGEIFSEIREKLKNPEKVDWDETMKNLQLAVNILKKHNRLNSCISA